MLGEPRDRGHPNDGDLLMLMTVAVVSLVNMLAPAAVRGIGGAPRRTNGLFDRDRTRRRVPAIAATALLLCTFGVGQAWAAEAPVKVDAARMNNADRDAANWLSYGRTYSEQRFSPLTKITSDNAKQLGLAWSADLDTNRCLERQDLRRYLRRPLGGTRRGDGQVGVERRDRRPKPGFYHHPGTARHQGTRRDRHE